MIFRHLDGLVSHRSEHYQARPPDQAQGPVQTSKTLVGPKPGSQPFIGWCRVPDFSPRLLPCWPTADLHQTWAVGIGAGVAAGGGSGTGVADIKVFLELLPADGSAGRFLHIIRTAVQVLKKPSS